MIEQAGRMRETGSAERKDSLFKRVVFNETGQMSVFIALMFQVLFVFFAMVINIGLLVHDKINLQNSVDLGAFYGAQRQAELLNEIAHINYQMRQDLKLLTWRYRVIGTLGRHGTNTASLPPPARRPGTGPLPDDPLLYYDGGTGSYQPFDEPPVVCAANQFWQQFGRLGSPNIESYCWQPYDSTSPPIPAAPSGASFLGINTFIVGYVNQARQQQILSCNQAAPLNWAFTMQMLYAYRQSIAIRKMMIWSLRKNLVSPDFKDVDNQSIRTGIEKTIQKNLTTANRSTLGEVEVLNGLSRGACGQDDGKFVMPEILTAPLLNFMNSFGNAAGCNYEMRAHTEYGIIPAASRQQWDPGGLMTQLSQGEPAPNDPLHSSLGFEKNPWCMAYIGVKAKSAPRKPFAPFGKEVVLEARSFAQPFGGRIGPWYMSQWPKGAPESSGGNRVDPLTPPRLNPGGGNIAYSAANLPNYSRYPGDTLGLRSQMALGAQRHIFNQLSRAGGRMLSLTWFAGFQAIPVTGDPMMWDPTGPQDQPLNSYPFGIYRQAELSAIAPDLFDATYYSIDPAGHLNYHQRHSAHPERFTFVPIFGQNPVPIPDLGARNGAHATIQSVQVEDQISTAVNAGLDPSALPALYYPLRSWEHLLTAWSPNRAVDFQFPEDRYGKCTQAANPAVMIPGKCAAGGRVGYSVRLISRDHLMGSNWSIGGAGQGPGTIENSPSGF